MPGGRPTFANHAEKMRVLQRLELYEGDCLKRRSDRIWEKASRQLGSLYHPHSLYMDVRSKRIDIPGPESNATDTEDNGADKVSEDEAAEQVSEDDGAGEVSEDDGDEEVSEDDRDGEVSEDDGIMQDEENSEHEQIVKADRVEKDKDDKEEKMEVDEGDEEDGDEQGKHDDEYEGEKKYYEDSIHNAEVHLSDTDDESHGYSYRGYYQKNCYFPDSSADSKGGEMDMEVDPLLNQTPLEVLRSPVKPEGQCGPLGGAESGSKPSDNDKSQQDELDPGIPINPNDQTEPCCDTKRSRSDLVEIPVILAGQPIKMMIDDDLENVVFENTWAFDCIAQILVTAAKDHPLVRKKIMIQAKQVDFYYFIERVVLCGLTEETFYLRAGVLQRLFPRYKESNDAIFFDCSIHVGLIGKRLLTYYPSYNETRLCTNPLCNLVQNQPVSVFAVAAAVVPNVNFKNILGEIIPYITGKSCTTCGGSARVTNQVIGDLVIFDLITQGDDTIRLKDIPTSITNPLETPPTTLDLIGVIQSKGCSGRLRSSHGSFVPHTAIAYRFNHWVEFNNEDPSNKNFLKSTRKINPQVLIYAKIDVGKQ